MTDATTKTLLTSGDAVAAGDVLEFTEPVFGHSCHGGFYFRGDRNVIARVKRATPKTVLLDLIEMTGPDGLWGEFRKMLTTLEKLEVYRHIGTDEGTRAERLAANSCTIPQPIRFR